MDHTEEEKQNQQDREKLEKQAAESANLTEILMNTLLNCSSPRVARAALLSTVVALEGHKPTDCDCNICAKFISMSTVAYTVMGLPLTAPMQEMILQSQALLNRNTVIQ